MPTQEQWSAARSRQQLYAAIRQRLLARGFLEVETPCLVPAPGMEPHITAFEVPFHPETDVGSPRTLFLHTSPEYAMKRLLADGSGPIFQLARVFRNGEVSPAHNPEFTLLELYRPQADYRAVMEDVEEVLAAGEAALGAPGFFSRLPYERRTVRDAVHAASGVDLNACPDAPHLARALEQAGVKARPDDPFEDLFFRLFLERVEPRLGLERPTFLFDYPAPLAALARLKPGDPRVAERFELYAHGAELANGFSELTDAGEQRRRLVEEQTLRRRLGRRVYPLDEPFLAALGAMPASGGVAVGMDRVLMQLLGRAEIESVLLFPARDFVE